jgi:hypothetical protein
MFMNIIYIIFVVILIVSFITGIIVTKFDKNLSRHVKDTRTSLLNRWF